MSFNKKHKFKTLYQKHWQSFLDRHPGQIPGYAVKTIARVMICGTEALGASIYKCLSCGFTLLIKHSCKARFCSICATAYIDKWAAKVKYWLSFINANYYFVTFHCPKET